MGAVNLDGFAGGAQGYFAVFAALEMCLQIGTHRVGHAVVDQVVEKGNKLSAGQRLNSQFAARLLAHCQQAPPSA